MRRSIVLVALVAACAAEPEDAACGGLRRTWRDTYRPPTTSAKRLVIGAGEGTTGTHTVAEWVSEARSATARRPSEPARQAQVIDKGQNEEQED